MITTRNSWKATWLSLCIVVSGFWVQPSSADSLSSYRYDWYFWKESGKYLPEHDWRWLKAQCYQESLLNPRAVSPAGAQGLCQFMPGTWQDAQVSLGTLDIWRPKDQIKASAWYMGKLNRTWSTRPRTPDQRRPLSQASYNAGLGNILKAQRKCDNALLWTDVSTCLPEVTGEHSKETITYVKRINHWFYQLATR